MARLREGKRIRETRLVGIQTGIPTYQPTELELKGLKLKFYDVSDNKVGEVGADIKEGILSEVEFELMDFGCGAFSFVLGALPAFSIAYRTRVDIHPYYDPTPWFTGFVQTIPRPGQKGPYKFSGFGFFEQLDWVTVTKSYANQEVSVIIKDIIQTFVDPPTQIIYNAAKVQTTSYTVNEIKFDYAFAKDAIQQLANIAQGYEFGVDDSREFYFRPIDTTVYFYYWAGRQFQDIEIEEDPVGIRNKLYVKSGTVQSGGSNIIGYVQDPASIAAYGLREELVTAPDVLNTADALQWAGQVLTEKATPKIKAKIKNILFDTTKTKIDSRGKINITTHEGTLYTLPIKRVLYHISAAGTLGEIECGVINLPFELQEVNQYRWLDEEKRLADKRTEQIFKRDEALTGTAKARAYRSGNQSNTASGWQKVQLNAETFDPGNKFDTSLNRYVVATAGYHSIKGSLEYQAGAAGTDRVNLAVYKNGALLTRLDDKTFASAGNLKLSGSDLRYLNVNDYIEIYYYTDKTDGIILGSESDTYLAVLLVSVD